MSYRGADRRDHDRVDQRRDRPAVHPALGLVELLTPREAHPGVVAAQFLDLDPDDLGEVGALRPRAEVRPATRGRGREEVELLSVRRGHRRSVAGRPLQPPTELRSGLLTGLRSGSLIELCAGLRCRPGVVPSSPSAVPLCRPGVRPTAPPRRQHCSTTPPDPEVPHGRGLHHRHRAQPGRAARRWPVAGAPCRSGRPTARRADGPHRRRPRRRRGRRLRLPRHDRTAGRRHRPHLLARCGAARGGARHDRRPPVRVVAAGGALRGTGCHVRDPGPGRGGRCAEHVRHSDLVSDARRGQSGFATDPFSGSEGWVKRYGDAEVSQFNGAG